MKMLVHRIPISEETPFELAELKVGLRVDHDDDNSVITQIGWTAAQEIEHFAQIALLTQTVRVTIFDPPSREMGLRLPIGPVQDDVTPTVTIDGEAFTGFDFAAGNRPYIRWLAPYCDLTPTRITIEYEAGFGAAASDIPKDLAQAILDQAALLFDNPSPVDSKALTTSPHMARIGARYRGVGI